MKYSEFVPPAPAGEWKIGCFRLPGWGSDPEGHSPGDSRLWGTTLRVESRDFALVSTRRPNHELYNEVAPYWPIRALMWFRCGEAEIPHAIRVSYAGMDSEEDLGVYPYGPYYTSRMSEGKVGCRMLGGVGNRQKPANLPSYLYWPKLEITWDYLLDAKSNDAVWQVNVRNASDAELKDVDVKLVFFLGPEFGEFRERVTANDGWSRVSDFGARVQSFAAIAKGMASGLAITADRPGAIELYKGCPTHGSREGLSPIVHLRAKKFGPGERLTGRVLVSVLLGREPVLPGTADVPNEDLDKLSYSIEPSSVRYTGGSRRSAPLSFSLAQWLEELKRPKTRELRPWTGDVVDSNGIRACIDRYVECHSNALGVGISQESRGAYEGEQPPNGLIVQLGVQGAEELIKYARAQGLRQIWGVGAPSGYKGLSKEAQLDGYRMDLDLATWADYRETNRFAEKFGYDITQADRAALVRYYSWLFAQGVREWAESVSRVTPGAGMEVDIQSAYQADRHPLNSDAMNRVFCEEFSKVPGPRLEFFYYGIDNGHIERQTRIAKESGISHVLFLPHIEAFLPGPLDLTDQLEAAHKGGAEGACNWRANDCVDWQICEWGVASQTYFPTPELPAFLLTWDLRGLVEALQGAESIAVEPAGDLTLDCDRGVEMLRLMLLKRAPLERGSRKGKLVVQVGMPQSLGSGPVAAKASAIVSACSAKGLPDEKGYIYPFEGGIWVGGGSPKGCERALGLMLQVARLASFGRESSPHEPVRDISDGIQYP